MNPKSPESEPLGSVTLVRTVTWPRKSDIPKDPSPSRTVSSKARTPRAAAAPTIDACWVLQPRVRREQLIAEGVRCRTRRA